PGGISAQVLHDLIPGEVVVCGSWELVSRKAAELARREETEAVVVRGPGSDRLRPSLQHNWFPTTVPTCPGGGQAGLAAAHDQQACPTHPGSRTPSGTSCGCGAQHPDAPSSAGASKMPLPPHTPVSGRVSSTLFAAARSPAIMATTLRTCSNPVSARNVGARP